MNLNGRTGELATIEAAVTAVAGGAGRSVILAGDAGIGKSALLAVLAARARGAGLVVLDVRAAEYERDIPFGVAIDALDDHVATLGPRRLEPLGPARLAHLATVLPSAATDAADLESQPERFHLQRALRALVDLLAKTTPLALIVDDLQWADDASLDWLLHLVRRPPSSPVLLALATRLVDPLPRLLDAARAAPAADVIELAPLTEAAARELLGGKAVDTALAERIVAEAEGNPLFLHELARVAGTSDDSLPATVSAAVQVEAATLPPASRALLEGAAVVGDPFDPELAAAAADLDLDLGGLTVLDRLVAQGLVRESGGRSFAFRHPLVRRAIYQAAPPGWRLGAHERVATALERRGAPPVARAWHVVHAARSGDEDAIQLLTAAGLETRGTSPKSAARWFEAALGLVPDERRERRLELTSRLARARAEGGDLVGAHEAFGAALALLPPEPTPDGLWLVSSAVLVDYLLGYHASARDRLTAALAALPEDAPPAVRLGLEMGLTVFAAEDRDHEALLALSRRAAAAAEGLSPASIASAEAYGAWAHRLAGDAQRAGAALDRASAMFGALAESDIASWPAAAYVLGWQHDIAERPTDALASVTRGIDAARGRHQDLLGVELAMTAGAVLLDLCRIADALAHLDTAEELARLQGRDRALADTLWRRALALDLAGDPAAADRAETECRELFGRLQPLPWTYAGLCALSARRVRDDPERAIADILASGGHDLGRVDATYAVRAMAALAAAEHALGNDARAREWARKAEEVSAREMLPIGRGRAQAAAALVDEDARELAVAADVLDAAGGIADALRARIAAARIETDRAVALKLLHAVADIAQDGGAAALEQEAVRELRKLGVRGARARVGSSRGDRAESALAALTPRELEIARLVAAGQPNKAVAAALFLSEKTVEANLTAIYSKLGLRSRVELAAAMARRDD